MTGWIISESILEWFFVPLVEETQLLTKLFVRTDSLLGCNSCLKHAMPANVYNIDETTQFKCSQARCWLLLETCGQGITTAKAHYNACWCKHNRKLKLHVTGKVKSPSCFRNVKAWLIGKKLLLQTTVVHGDRVSSQLAKCTSSPSMCLGHGDTNHHCQFLYTCTESSLRQWESAAGRYFTQHVSLWALNDALLWTRVLPPRERATMSAITEEGCTLKSSQKAKFMRTTMKTVSNVAAPPVSHNMADHSLNATL